MRNVYEDLHIYALGAGKDVYVYRGFNRETVHERAQSAAVGFIAANVDVGGNWLQPEHYYETRVRIMESVGREHFHEMWRSDHDRACIACGADLTDRMGCYVFVTRGVSYFLNLEGRPLICVGCNTDRGGNTFSLDNYRRLIGQCDQCRWWHIRHADKFGDVIAS